ncbi:MAG: PEP-CTERM sorting domain-containing protein [Planctomycetota bacterium]
METSDFVSNVGRMSLLAGSAVLAGAASGQIEYTPVGGVDGLLDGDGDIVPIDFNGDGTREFEVFYEEPAAGNLNIKLEAFPDVDANNVTDEILVDPTQAAGNSNNPLALALGEAIDPNETATRAWQFIGRTDTGLSPSGISNSNGGGNFRNVGVEEFIGVRTVIDGNTHYGWVGIQITALDDVSDVLTGVVTGYAYETTPGVGIAAGAIPAPGTAALLALGAIGASSRKRR